MLKPENFYGRTEQLAVIRRLVLDEKRRCLVLHGMAGSGKSSLAAAFIVGLLHCDEGATDVPLAHRTGASDDFGFVLWWRLTDAPQLCELAREVVGLATGEYPTDLPRDAEHLSAVIISAFAHGRGLVVLDNLETLLGADTPQRGWRRGYENYGIFLRNACETSHTTTILVTTREVPKVFLRAEETTSHTQVMLLDGLAPGPFRRTLASRGNIAASDGALAWLATRYDGNPLAAKILGNYVVEVHQGSVDRFRESQPDILPRFNDLLEFHFARLSGEERELAYWLAINREPVPIQTLTEDLLSCGSREKVYTTLQCLRARIPLESDGQGFSLQPVLLDYLTLRICTKVGKLFECSSKQLSVYISQLVASDIAKEFQNGEFGLLDRVALLKAHAAEHVRRAQRTNVVTPLLDRLRAVIGSNEAIAGMLRRLISDYRNRAGRRPSYMASNIVTLLLELVGSLQDDDFSNLTFIHPYFAGCQLLGVDFSGSRFIRPVFTEKLGAILTLAVSPCGRYAVAGDTLGMIRKWDLQQHRLVFSSPSDRLWVRTVAFVGSGTIVSAGHDGSIYRHDAETGAQTARVPGHSQWVSAITELPGGRGFVSAGEDGRVVRWDVGIAPVFSVDLGGLLYDVIVDAQRNLLYVAASGGRIYALSTENGKIVSQTAVDVADVHCLALSDDSELLAGGDARGQVTLWNPASLRPVRRFQARTTFVRAMLFLHRMLLVGGEDGGIRVFDCEFPEFVTRFFSGHSAPVQALKQIPSTTRLVSASEDKALMVWDLRSDAMVDKYVGFSATVWSAHVSSEGSILAGTEPGEVLQWTNMSAEPRVLTRHRGRVFAVRAHPEIEVAASAGIDGVVRVVDLLTGEEIGCLTGHEDWIKRLRFSLRGSMLFSASEDNTVRCWNWRTGEAVWTSSSHKNRVTALHIGSRRTLLSGDEDGAIIEHDLTSGHVSRRIAGHAGKVRCLATDREGTRLFSAGEDGLLRIWRIEQESEPNAQVAVSAHELWSLDYSAAHGVLVTGDNEGCLRVLDTEGSVLEERQAHRGPIWDLQLNRGGELASLASGDEALSVWGLEPLTETCRLKAPQPYGGSDFSDTVGIPEGQKRSLASLGAVF